VVGVKIYVWCRDAWRPVEVSGLDSSGKPVYVNRACDAEGDDDITVASARGTDSAHFSGQRFDRAA
jgi:hypothetical protein